MPTAPAAVPPQWQAVARFYGAILCIGLGVGLLAAGFHAALDALAAARHWMSTQDTGLANSFLDRLGVTPFRLQSWMISALGGALLSTAAVALVRRFAPDTAGSGIPEVVATLRGLAQPELAAGAAGEIRRRGAGHRQRHGAGTRRPDHPPWRHAGRALRRSWHDRPGATG